MGTSTLWAKLEGYESVGLGGSKLRNLEFLVADASLRGCTTMILHGLREANFTYLAAECAEQFGMQSVMFLAELTKFEEESPRKRNVIANSSVRVEIISRLELVIRNLVATRLGHRAATAGHYLVPIGGASPVGCLGGFYAAIELRDQIASGVLPCPDSIVVPFGSGGLVAGLLAGLVYCELTTITLNIVYTSRTPLFDIIRRLASETFRIATGGKMPRYRREALRYHGAFTFGGFAHSSPVVTRAISDAFFVENLLLDPLYSAKAFLAFLSLAANSQHSLLWLTNPQRTG